MNAKDALRGGLLLAKNVTQMLLGDLSDADLLVRPVEGANHIAWQIGHVLKTENQFIREQGGTPAELPADFDAKHSKDTAASNSASDFYTKGQYAEFLNKVRTATLALLDAMPDAKLDAANTGPLAGFAPTIGSMFLLLSNHEMMHTGQFTVIRRKLGKPVLF